MRLQTVVVLVMLALLPRPGRAANFLVNSSAAGAFDTFPGDGICEATTGVGDCTLAAAVDETNALPGSDTIALPPGALPLPVPQPGKQPLDAKTAEKKAASQ